ncbi:MAG: hypothetical protein ABR606_05465 [Vicinamibacterales bacterium]
MAAAPFIAAVLIFVALTLAITWPAASVVGIRLIGDLGDPLFVTWVMTWVMSHLSRAAGGDVSALEGFWHANIFYPERYTLAYSEHFVGQSLQVLPLWWITGNAVLSYNLVVLSTFVLTGLGTFLLTRALTGGWVGPLLAGVMATFNPYRLELELSHLHVLSIQWLPLALVAVHGFIRSGSRRYLLATALCVLALNLSSVYFMLFCAPVLALFTLVDLTLQGKLPDSSRWAGLAVAGAGIVLMTAPFVLPYWRVNLEMGFERSFAEIRAHSATLSQYAEYLLPWAHLPLLFAALGAVAAFLPRPPASRALILTVIGLLALVFVLSLGPVLPVAQVRGPYWLLYEYVPGFRGLRVVNRYGALVFDLSTGSCRRRRCVGRPLAAFRASSRARCNRRLSLAGVAGRHAHQRCTALTRAAASTQVSEPRAYAARYLPSGSNARQRCRPRGVSVWRSLV